MMTKTYRRSPRRAGLVATTLAALLLAGCGVPSSGPATKVEDVPKDDVGQDAEESERPLEPSENAVDTVDAFLGASAGDWSGRDKRLDQFVSDSVDWSELTEGIQLVRLDSDGIAISDDESSIHKKVKVTGEIVGIYTQNGQMKPWTGSDDFSQTYDLTRGAPDQVWSIVSPPRQVALQDSDFAERYEPNPLYFPAISNISGTLAPDLRWMPVASNDVEVRYNELTEWLVAGPSEWLGATVTSAFPEGTARKSVVVDKDSDVVTVEIAAEAAAQPAEDVERMSAQLAWTLGLQSDQVLSLRVDGQERLRSEAAEWSSWNKAPSEDVEREDLAYFVSAGEISATDPDAPFVGTDADDLSEAALEPEGDRIAGVFSGDDGAQLLVGEEDSVEPVAGFSASQLSDPQWVDDETILVLADGELRTVDLESGDSAALSPGEDDESVTAMSLAPDARRVAYVADGDLWVATVLVDDDGDLKLGEPRPVGTNLSGVDDVGWSRETHLLAIGTVSGESGWLWETSIDSAFQVSPLSGDTTPRADALAVRCSPAEVRTNREGQPTLLEIDGVINRLYSSVSPVTVRDADGGVSNATGSSPFTAP